MTVLTAAPVAATGKAKGKASPKVRKDRIQLDFAPRAMERLNALKAKTEASSYAEVVKNALRLYEALIEETESGKQFLVRDQDGVVSSFRLFLQGDRPPRPTSPAPTNHPPRSAPRRGWRRSAGRARADGPAG
jgi:hypothetical protein